MNEQESLSLIRQMISTAKNNLRQGTARIFLFWGYLIAGIGLVNLVFLTWLPEPQHYRSFLIWFLTPAGVIFHRILVGRLERDTKVTTYVDLVMNYVWIGFSISVFLLAAGMLAASIPGFLSDGHGPMERLKWIHWLLLIPMMMILYGFAMFVSGKAYHFAPLTWGAWVCWAIAMILFLLLGNPYAMEFQLAGLILGILAGYIIPGHLLAKKEKSHVSGS